MRELDVARYRVGNSRRGAAIRHQIDLQVGHGDKRQRGELHRRPVAAVTDRHAVGLGLGELDHIGERVGR